MRLTIAEGVADVEPEAWARLETGPSPFCDHAFLAALERSGSVGPGTGWKPLVLLAWEKEELLGAVVAYVKSHSYGEYIFDWAWAEGSQRAGLRYFPKLVVAVPFTPATGRRILLAPGAPPDLARQLVLALHELAVELGLSSVHWLFVTPQERDLLAQEGYLPRMNVQYHWRNRGWDSFDDCLASMRSKRRREIRRERRSARREGLAVQVLAGRDMEDSHWTAVERFYRSTAARKWGTPYLTSNFFELLRETFAHKVRFVVAQQEGRPVAGALAFQGDAALYGRYWGADEHLRHLHFETCYYTPIEYCIEEGIELFEAGAQGPHKVPRGFLPSEVHSAHWLARPDLMEAVSDFIEKERRHNLLGMEHLAQRSPYSEL